jgi:hypothetical protein
MINLPERRATTNIVPQILFSGEKKSAMCSVEINGLRGPKSDLFANVPSIH